MTIGWAETKGLAQAKGLFALLMLDRSSTELHLKW